MMMTTDEGTITTDTGPNPEADRYMTRTIAGLDLIGGRGLGRVPGYGLFEGGEALDIAVKILSSPGYLFRGEKGGYVCRISGSAIDFNLLRWPVASLLGAANS